MATKRSIDVILDDTLPQESKESYQKAWGEFINYVGEERKPVETDFLQYFDFLHTQRKQKASTLWCENAPPSFEVRSWEPPLRHGTFF